MIGKHHIVIGIVCALLSASAWAKDTTYVSGAIQHGGLLDWSPVMYHSNSYVDLSVHHLYNTANPVSFKGIRASTRAELTQWPLLGYESDFGGHGIGHLSLAAEFNWGEITIGDVYAQFGSGLVLSIYEDRSLGIDGALRGAKFHLTPYQGVAITLIGGKQRRYWNCYHDHAWGWNYSRDAALGADLELSIEQWSKTLQEKEMHIGIGGSYVSKYEAFDTIPTPMGGGLVMYNVPRWVGAGEVRAEWALKGWNILVEYAYKANDPTAENDFSYRPGEALMASLSYSRKGLSVLAQVKRSDNMSFRSERQRRGLAGRLNHMPAFAQQHTYALAALYPYATQYTNGEWAFQGEVRYTCPRKTKMGGKYGTTLKLSAAHIRGLAAEGSWAIDTDKQGEYYTDVNIELNKRITKNWWLNAMLMYQTYNRTIVEGKGGLVRSGIAVVESSVRVHPNVSMRGELQYLYSPHYQGQWVFALYELSLYNCVTVSGQWMYNIGHAQDATNEHFYTVEAAYTHKAHRVSAGYTKTREGFNCSGGVCRYVPKQEGVTLNYSFTF